MMIVHYLHSLARHDLLQLTLLEFAFFAFCFELAIWRDIRKEKEGKRKEEKKRVEDRLITGTNFSYRYFVLYLSTLTLPLS